MGTLLLVLLWGVPMKHDLIFLWLGLGMAACSFEVSRVVRDWLPLVAIIFVYDLLRGVADGLLFSAREIPQIKIERAIFGAPVPTVWLQEHFWHGANHLHWWDYAAWFLHLTHFFLTFVALAVIWVFAREHFSRYAAMVCALALAGFTTYVLYPAAPPWMAARQGNLGESNRIVGLVWHHLPISSGGAIFEHGQGYANDVAAIPSLHAAFAVLFSLYVWRLVPRYVRPLVAVYPVAMSLALVYLGEHYVLDCILGWIYAVAVFMSVNWAFELRARRALRLEPAPAD